MPNLPDYSSPLAQRGVEPSGRGIDAVEQAGRAWNSALHQIGDAAQETGNALEKNYAQQDLTKQTQGAADFEVQQTKSWEDAKANGISADDWYNKQYLPALDGMQQSMDPQSVQGQAHLDQWSAIHRASTYKSIVGEQSKIDSDNSVSSIKDSTGKYANLAAQYPERAAELAGQSSFNIDGMVQSHQLAPEHKTALQVEARQAIYDSAIRGIVARAEAPGATPAQIDAARQQIEKDEFVSNTSPGIYVTALDSLTKAKTSQINIQGNIAALALGDVRKQLDVTGDIGMYQKGLGLIAGIQEKTPEATAMRQAEERKKLDDSFAAGRVTSGVMTAPAADLAKAVTAFDTQFKNETDPQKLGIMGSQRTAIDTALKKRDTELRQDASKYSLTYSPTVQQAYQQYQQAAPQDKALAFAQYAATSTGFQQMVNPGRPANVMTDDIRAEAHSAVAAIRTPAGPSATGGALVQMAKTYGRYWPQISEQLRKEKVFSGDEGVAARLYGNPGSQALAETILNASAATGAERFGMHQVPEMKAVNLAIPALGVLTKSLGNTGAAGADFANAYTYALAHAIQYTGVSDPNGVAVYAKKMVLDQFSFPKAVPTLRVSNDLHIDPDRVADGAVAVQAGIGKHQLYVPPSYSGLNTKDQGTNYTKQIASTGKWYTNENGTGALLYDEDGHNVQEIRNGKRVDVELTWDELGKVADKQPLRATFKAAAGVLDKARGSK